MALKIDRDREMGNHMRAPYSKLGNCTWSFPPHKLQNPSPGHLNLQPALSNGHVNRKSHISHRGFRSRTLVEGLFSPVYVSLILTLVTPFVERPLCPGEATIHSRRRCLEAWDPPNVIPCRCPR